MATGTPTPSTPVAIGPINGYMPNEQRIVATITPPASYTTGGEDITLPTSEIKGLDLKGINILNPVDLANSWYFMWDGSLTTPQLEAYVITTGAQVASTTDVSGWTLYVEFIYAG